MFTEFTVQSEIQQQERELVQRLERRRVAAERAVEQHGGQRLAVVAHLARRAREEARGRSAPRPVTGA